MTRLTIPIQVVSESNRREHFRVAQKRKAPQRWIVRQYLRLEALTTVPSRVKFVRLLGARQREYDGDNVQSAFKAIRDEVAKYFGVNDGPRGPITWEYAQERSATGAGGIRIECE